MNDIRVIIGIVIGLMAIVLVVGIVLVIDVIGGRGGPKDPTTAETWEFGDWDGDRANEDIEYPPVPTVEELRQKIRNATPGRLRDVLAELASPEVLFGRDALLQATGEWIAERRMNEIRWVALALLEKGNPDAALFDLFDACSLSLATGDADVDQLEAMESLGNQIASILEGRVTAEALPPSEREQLLHALIRFGGLGSIPEEGLFVAAALGGAGEGNPYAARHLADMVRESGDPGVQALAARRLGNVGTVRELLDLTGFRLDPPPATPEDAELCRGFLGGLHLAVTRLPEQVSAATPAFNEVLRTWDETREQNQMRLELLELLSLHPVPTMEATLVELTTDANSDVADAASKALQALTRQ